MATPFHAELVTPERILFSGDVEEVSMRTDEGEISFLAGHEDYIAAADITVLRLVLSAPSGDEGGSELRAAVHGGFVHVDRSGVALLASVAELASDIDVPRARAALERAEADLASGERGPGPAAERAADVRVVEEAVVAGAGITPADATAGSSTLVTPSPAMAALLSPDDPEVQARRARVRLEAAGAA